MDLGSDDARINEEFNEKRPWYMRIYSFKFENF